MSRNLPDRPNLEYLKKEAKALLDTMQQTDAAAQLADAQHALAREYGFASWPKLKAHVAAIAGTAPHPLIGRWIADVADRSATRRTCFSAPLSSSPSTTTP